MLINLWPHKKRPPKCHYFLFVSFSAELLSIFGSRTYFLYESWLIVQRNWRDNRWSLHWIVFISFDLFSTQFFFDCYFFFSFPFISLSLYLLYLNCTHLFHLFEPTRNTSHCQRTVVGFFFLLSRFITKLFRFTSCLFFVCATHFSFVGQMIIDWKTR